MDSQASFLPDRGIVAVEGPDAADLLNRLFTNSTLGMEPGESRYAAFLSPQGKLNFDFLVVASTPSAFLLDCLATRAPDLAKRLTFQKLRAKVTIADRSSELGVAAIWNERQAPNDGLVTRDPRHDALGWRIIGARSALASTYPDHAALYDAHRVHLGVPEGGLDFSYGDAFVHDANLDLLHGVDYKKGCYVGQEVVARVHFRKSARKRIVQIRFDTAPLPGTDITAGDISLGTIGSVAAGEGLALIRLDRLAEARASGTAIRAGDCALDIVVPAALATAHG